MNKIIRLARWIAAPYRKIAAARQASVWAVRIANDDMSQRELDAFVAWLSADPIHSEKYTETVRVLSSPLPFSRSEIEELIDGQDKKTLPKAAENQPNWLYAFFRDTRLKPSICFGTLAVAIALVLGATNLTFINDHNHVTSIGERAVIELPEGSVIHLNTQSQASVEFTDGVRFVSLLSGEAFFDVATDKDRPFVVQTANATVRALGTRFNVRSGPSGSDIAVLEGAVEVKGEVESDDSAKVFKQTVEKGQLLSYNVERGVTEFGTQNVDVLTAWINGRVEFSNVSLAEAVAEINRYQTKPITIRDPEIRALNISGSFDIDTTSGFIAALSRMDYIEVVEKKQEIILVKIK